MWLTSPEARELSPSLPISRLSYAMNNNNMNAIVDFLRNFLVSQK